VVKKTDGIDFDTAYKFSTETMGDFNFTYNLTWVHKFTEIPEEEGELGSLNNEQTKSKELAGQFEHPQFRWNAGMDWGIEEWQASARLNYIGEYQDDIDAGAEGTIDAMVTLDLNVTYIGFDNWTLTLGGNNVFNQDPPFSAADNTGYDKNTHSAIGAFWYTKASYRF